MSLYNKYRPRTFGDVQGHKIVVDSVTNKLAIGTFAHAYIMAGQKGTGKTTVAKLIGQYLSCESPIGFEPCNECKSCKASINESHSDIYEIDGASNNGVDDIRRLKEEINYPPMNGKFKVYIIDEVHMLSTSAFNALLKTIEEPPKYVVFILATTELHKVPGTIRSRCEIHTFTRMKEEVISARLKYIANAEGFNLLPDAADLLAKNSDGSMRDAISILSTMSHHDQINIDIVMESLGLIDESLTDAFVEAMMSNDTQTSIAIYQGILEKGKTAIQLIESIIQLLVSRMMYGEKVGEYSIFLKEITNFKREVAKETNVQLLFNLLIIDYTTKTPFAVTDDESLNKLTDRVNKLESGITKRLERIEIWIKKFIESRKSKSSQTQKEQKSGPAEDNNSVDVNQSTDVNAPDTIQSNSVHTREEYDYNDHTEDERKENVTSSDMNMDKKEENDEIIDEVVVNKAALNAVDDVLSRLSSFGL